MNKLLSVLLLAILPAAFGDSAASVAPGKPVTITVAVAGGSQPFTYAWQKDGQTIPVASVPSAATATLVLPGVAGLAGTYTCVVTNDFGSAVSDKAVLTVGSPPSGVTTSFVK